MRQATFTPEPRACERCNGSGETHTAEFSGTDSDGTPFHYPAKTSVCYCCKGAKQYEAPDYLALVKGVLAKQPGRSQLLSRRPDDARAYYVWRWMRFHLGEDVCLPVMASLDVNGDPFEPEMQMVSEYAAKVLSGHGSAGIARWAGAMAGTSPTGPLPPSAFSGGPVADSIKPEEEVLELY